jgi:hypothetical protein
MNQLKLQFSDPFYWVFSLSNRKPVQAEIRIHGDATLAEVRELRRCVNFIEETFGSAPTDQLEAIQPGDIVQLKPSADRVFGGLLLRVKKVDPIRGYLLIPRRGGSLETWTRCKACEVDRIGGLRWPEAAWGFRGWGSCGIPPAGEQYAVETHSRAARPIRL